MGIKEKKCMRRTPNSYISMASSKESWEEEVEDVQIRYEWRTRGINGGGEKEGWPGVWPGEGAVEERK